jgi:hypothetical protein
MANKTIRISEARLNDFCYLLLKKAYFEPHFNNASPRECDIRVCMDMSAPEKRASIASAILLPDEIAPSRHDVYYDVDPGQVFDVTMEYLVDHWRAEPDAKELKQFRKEWLTEIVPKLLEMEESACGPQGVNS